MEEAARLCDRVGIMERGQVIALGAPAELTAALDASPDRGVAAGGVPLAPATLEDVFVALTGRHLRED
jgi:ABC-2 type transport system ATP-binding protein